ncbi:hypothetical protein AKO1_001752 [Acrasis kona]|uniref:BLOC-1-related complex subunit 7 n=1 Tax=Acrasis kona TaxID=1008807 RepID=A0AAW2Z8G7_9EUKA
MTTTQPSKPDLHNVTKVVRLEIYERSDEIINTTTNICRSIIEGSKFEENISKQSKNLASRDRALMNTSDLVSSIEVVTRDIESEVSVIESRLKEIRYGRDGLDEIKTLLQKFPLQ